MATKDDRDDEVQVPEAPLSNSALAEKLAGGHATKDDLAEAARRLSAVLS